MIGGGNYPVMSDWEWAHAPWNEPDLVLCRECGGEGQWYCDIGNNEISVEQYARLPKEEKENWCLVCCSECNGTGEVYGK